MSDPVQTAKVDLAEKLKLIPDRPGVYLMKDKAGQVIYVGKAVSLRRRVRSYFQGGRYQGSKVARMVQEIADLEYIVTDSEVEALILESNLIKLHHPWFNVKLRDDKAYPYLKVTVNETYPRVLFVRRPRPDGARYFGPYTDSSAVRDTLQWIRKLFAIRTCELDLDKGQRLKRPCLLYYIGRCPGPCVDGLTTPEAYRQVVDEVCLFLEGRHQKLLPQMQEKMKQAAAALDFERAARLRDRLQSLTKVVERQKVVSPQGGDSDVLGLAVDEATGLACVAILFVRDGKLVGRDSFFLDSEATREQKGSGKEGEAGALEASHAKAEASDPPSATSSSQELQEILTAFLGGYYGQAGFVPPEVWLPLRLPGHEEQVWSEWLGQRRQELLAAQGRSWEVAETVPTQARSSPDYTPEEWEAEECGERRRAAQRRQVVSSSRARATIRLLTPRRGERYQLVGLACENAQEILRARLAEEERREAANQSGLQGLKEALGLADLPWRIECYDISNLQEKDSVAAMVVLEGGEPAPSEYRKFKMRTPGPNDFAMMHEVIDRRFRRGLQERKELRALGLLGEVEKRPPGWLRESQPDSLGSGREQVNLEIDEADAGDAKVVFTGACPQSPNQGGAQPEQDNAGKKQEAAESRQAPEKSGGRSADQKVWAKQAKFARFPDLVVIDGGPGQLGAARQALRNLGLAELPTIGLAKQNEWVYLEDDPEPLILPRNSPALHLLQRVRDEAHRFGITFNRQLRGKRTFRSALDDVPGVGPARKKALIRAFGSVAGVRRATVDELAAVPGVSRALAERIAEQLGNPAAE